MARGTTRRRGGGDPSSSTGPNPDKARRAAYTAAKRTGCVRSFFVRLMGFLGCLMAGLMWVLRCLMRVLRFLIGVRVSRRTSILLAIFIMLVSCVWYRWSQAVLEAELVSAQLRMKRSVTPLDAPLMMDLPQFQGDHKESLYWGTYRPNVYLGIRARTPMSLIAGLMWLGVKKRPGEEKRDYFIHHVCQDFDDLKYGWEDHNGRDYGRQEVTDHSLHLRLTTSFLKEKGEGSGYGGDWAVRLDAQNKRARLSETQQSTADLFFYIADEAGESITMGSHEPSSNAPILLAFGSRKDVGNWELHLRSEDNLKIHRAGFRSMSMHNLSDLVGRAVMFNAKRTGKLILPKFTQASSNIVIYQVSIELPGKVDIVFLSGAGSNNPMIADRINRLTGPMLSTRLESKRKDFQKRYDQIFNANNKIVSKELCVGRVALSSILGGIGYFHGQSKIEVPKRISQKDGVKHIPYWPAALYTSVPSRSSSPRGVLWDEGFHQLVLWRWDVHVSMDIIGHWLDLINTDGWIPPEQFLGAEALSKVSEELVLQRPSTGKPPILFLVLRDLVSGIQAHQFSSEEAEKISTFLEKAHIRLHSWFQWFNITQSGKHEGTFFWHARESTPTSGLFFTPTIRELNPKASTSGMDDYPRASHPNDEERHVDLRCWLLLASNCMRSIAQLLKMDTSFEKDYYNLSNQLSNFWTLNKMHLDNRSGAYFDYGKHSEKVRLRWSNYFFADLLRWSSKRQGLLRESFFLGGNLRETLQCPYPRLQLVPQIGYVSLFPFMMGAIPPESWILDKQLDIISDRSILWTDYGLRSLSRTSSMYMKRNGKNAAPYWRGPIWTNMNYMILSGLHHYSHEDGPYMVRAGELYDKLRSNLIRNIVRSYEATGFFWEMYDQKNKGKGKRARWSSIVVLIMSESYPALHR